MAQQKYSIAASNAELAGQAGDRLLLAGQLVYASLHLDAKPLSSYSPARTLDASSGQLLGLPLGLLAGLSLGSRKNQPKVYLYVDANVLALPKVRCAFLIEAYLAWGRKQKGCLALIGGTARKDEGFLLDVLVFEEGRLVALYDQELPQEHSPRFALAIASVLRRIQENYPGARMVQAAPLVDWALPGVEYLGDEVLRALSFRRIGQQADSKRQLALPLAIVVCGAVFALVAIGMAWGRYNAAIAHYERAISDSAIARQGGLDAQYLSLLAQRQQFMALPRVQETQTAKLLTMIDAIAVLPEVQIVEIKCSTIKLSETSMASEAIPDTWLRISLPKNERPALEQAQEILAKLAANTRMSWRLVPRGWQEDRARRIFTVEGFSHA